MESPRRASGADCVRDAEGQVEALGHFLADDLADARYLISCAFDDFGHFAGA